MTFYTYSFEKLEVWKDSKELTKLIYQVTEKFPKNERSNDQYHCYQNRKGIYHNWMKSSS